MKISAEALRLEWNDCAGQGPPPGRKKNNESYQMWLGLEPELLDGVLARVQAGSDLADCGEHGDAAVVQLPSAHLVRVIVEPRQGVAEVAGLLLLVLHEDDMLKIDGLLGTIAE